MKTSHLTDTHCHLYLDHYQNNLQETLQRAVEQNVREIWLPAINWTSLEQMESLSHPDIRFYKMAGIHPCDVNSNWPLDENRLYDKASESRYVALGETGLDYYWSRDHVKEQKQSLRVHCRIARATGKPVVLHNRESTTDLLDLIEQEQDGTLTGVWHCFTGTLEEGRRALDLGLYLGIGGVLTFKNSQVDTVVPHLPADRLLLETDAPYLAPAPKRGEQNEPSYVHYTARCLAGLIGISLEELAEMTTENAHRLFGTNT